MKKKELGPGIFAYEIYKDKVTGISGKATAYITYGSGCDQVKLTYTSTDKIACERWVHITELEDFKVQEEDKVPGGPTPNLPSHTSNGV
jgi:hypothetical protein